MSKFMAKQRESRFDDYDGGTRKVAGKGKSTRILNTHVLDESYTKCFEDDEDYLDYEFLYKDTSH